MALVDTPNLANFSKAADKVKQHVGTGVCLRGRLGAGRLRVRAAQGGAAAGAGLRQAPQAGRAPVGTMCVCGCTAFAAGCTAPACWLARPSRSTPRRRPRPAVIYVGSGDEAALEVIRGAGISAQSFADFVAGGEGAEVEAVPPKPDDICCIMYTR